jgi:hypothetical protein
MTSQLSIGLPPKLIAHYLDNQAEMIEFDKTRSDIVYTTAKGTIHTCLHDLSSLELLDKKRWERFEKGNRVCCVNIPFLETVVYLKRENQVRVKSKSIERRLSNDIIGCPRMTALHLSAALEQQYPNSTFHCSNPMLSLSLRLDKLESVKLLNTDSTVSFVSDIFPKGSLTLKNVPQMSVDSLLLKLTVLATWHFINDDMGGEILNLPKQKIL